MRAYHLSLLTLAAVTGLAAQPALAQGHPGGPGGPGGSPDMGFHREERAPMPDFDFPHWREGRWHHGPHDGRDGWWWIVGGVWYFYAAPVYPYPDIYTPPTVVVETSPEPGASYAYYCASPRGYFPYISVCSVTWQRVARVTVSSASAPVVESSATGQRTLDDRQLNAYGAELADIDLTGKAARAKLKNLADRVALFHKSLFERGYNAMDILKDTEDLEKRIADTRTRAR